jgi:Tfp pilus assembly pilus retraction ATPase PilT
MTSILNTVPSVTATDLPGPDFTVYVENLPDADGGAAQTAPEVEDEAAARSPRPKQSDKDPYSDEGSFEINHPGGAKIGRGVACLAYGGNYRSVTLRCSAKNKRVARHDYLASVQRGLQEYASRSSSPGEKAQDYLGFCPEGEAEYSKLWNGTPKPPDTSSDIFLNDIYQVCEELYRILSLDPAGSPTGLVTFTGATDSSKSLIARGLIFLFLQAAASDALAKRKRRPHLITFEDPIEEYYIKDSATQAPPKKLDDLNQLLAALNIDYTPRQKDVDADNLTNVIRNAKRQTPALLFVGETRDSRDWKELLSFAGSGHLVFTTSHAASVVEAMSQILRETETQTPSQRSEVARRIIGIVNTRKLNPITFNGDAPVSGARALLPAVWKNTPQSVNNLVADGLSSILPALDRESEIGYYGRTYFARQLTHDSRTTDRFKSCNDKADLQQAIMRTAMEWDIGGF